MIKQKLFDDFMARVSEVMAASPAKDVEKNVKAAVSGMLARMDVVTREEFDDASAASALASAGRDKVDPRLARRGMNGFSACELYSLATRSEQY